MKGRDILLFNSIDKAINISVHFDKGKFWLTQKAMSELFGVDRSVVTKHLKNIFSTNELNQDSVCANFAHTALSNSSSAKIFLICLVITVLSLQNTSAI